MIDPERIIEVLRETEILKHPHKLISTSGSTSLHFYVLTKPVYLEVFSHYGPETKIREGLISWEEPKLLTPGYMLNMEGFSKEAREAFKILARDNPDLAGLLYKMRYKKEFERSETVAAELEETFARLEKRIEQESDTMSVVIKGVEQYWDVSLMKYVQELLIKSAYQAQLPYLESMGYLTREQNTYMVTRNLEGLPLAARKEIEKYFAMVKDGEMEPAQLKKELDRWGVFPAYQDRFFDLFRKR